MSTATGTSTATIDNKVDNVSSAVIVRKCYCESAFNADLQTTLTALCLESTCRLTITSFSPLYCPTVQRVEGC